MGRALKFELSHVGTKDSKNQKCGITQKISRENFGGEFASYLLCVGREYSIATS
jgi:hypothetical protein